MKLAAMLPPIMTAAIDPGIIPTTEPEFIPTVPIFCEPDRSPTLPPVTLTGTFPITEAPTVPDTDWFGVVEPPLTIATGTAPKTDTPMEPLAFTTSGLEPPIVPSTSFIC